MYDFISNTQGFLLTTILFVKICQFSYISRVVALGCVRRSHDLELKLCFFGMILSPYRALRYAGSACFWSMAKRSRGCHAYRRDTLSLL